MENHLLILLGLHPKVMVESLYALSVKRNINVSRVTVISTESAREKTIETLLTPDSGKFHQLCKEYPEHFNGISFSGESIRVATNGHDAIWDISNSAQSQAYLDLILTAVDESASDEKTCLHAVAGGGRRTLSVYLAMVMQLLAREQDQLYHLVVDPWEVEINSDFYFPTKESKMMVTNSGAKFDAAKINVELVEVPFIRMRNRFAAGKLNTRTGQQLINWAQQEVNGALVLPQLTLNLNCRSLLIGEDAIHLQPQEFCLYWYFADLSRRRPQHIEFVAFEDYFEPSGSPYFSDEMLVGLLERFDAISPDGEMRRNFVANVLERRQLPMSWVLQKISRINGRIRERLSQAHLIPFYNVSAVGRRGAKYYGIKVEGNKIKTPAPEG